MNQLSSVVSILLVLLLLLSYTGKSQSKVTLFESNIKIKIDSIEGPENYDNVYAHVICYDFENGLKEEENTGTEDLKKYVAKDYGWNHDFDDEPYDKCSFQLFRKEGFFKDAYLKYTLDGLSLQTPIQATITACQVEKLSFKNPVASLNY